jgi:AraC-like DNA-binding protein
MNHALIVESMQQQLLPRIAHRKFHVLPATERLVATTKNFEPIFPYKLHSHSFFEWVWCIDHHAFLQMEDDIYRLDSGDFYLAPPGKMHVEMHHSSQQEYRVLWCAYRNETIGAHLHSYTPIGNLTNIAGISAPAPPYTNSILGALQLESKTQLLHRYSINSILVEALALLMLRAFETAPDHDQDFIPGKVAVKVNHYLSQHFGEPLALADVARALHVSRNYLATLYKHETGTTIGKRLTEIRLEKAKQYLLESQLSVQQISAAAGFATPEHFSRVFHQHEGTSPGKYGK